MCLLWGLTAAPVYWLRRRDNHLWRGSAPTGLAALGGVVSLLAYGIVIFAMTRAPMGCGIGPARNQRTVRGPAGAACFLLNP